MPLSRNLAARHGNIIDRVVDGGYFENFGASTALELARVLKARGLSPQIILINNEPTTTDRLENPTTFKPRGSHPSCPP